MTKKGNVIIVIMFLLFIGIFPYMWLYSVHENSAVEKESMEVVLGEDYFIDTLEVVDKSVVSSSTEAIPYYYIYYSTEDGFESYMEVSREFYDSKDTGDVFDGYTINHSYYYDSLENLLADNYSSERGYPWIMVAVVVITIVMPTLMVMAGKEQKKYEKAKKDQ